MHLLTSCDTNHTKLLKKKDWPKKRSEFEPKAEAERLAREKVEAAAKVEVEAEADHLSKAKTESDGLLAEIERFKKFFVESEKDRKSFTQKLIDSQNDNENLRAEIETIKKALFESESTSKTLNYFQSDSNIQFQFLDWKKFINRIRPNKGHDKLSAEIERIKKKFSTAQQKTEELQVNSRKRRK